MTDWTDPQNIIALGIVIVAILAFFVSLYSIYQSNKAFAQQQKHNQLSVRPICNIGHIMGTLGCVIWIANTGVGPMIIKSIKTRNNQGNVKDYPGDWIPQRQRQGNLGVWKDLENTSLLSGGRVELVNFGINPQIPVTIQPSLIQLTEEQKGDRDEIFGILKDLTISVTYEDIYGIEQPEYQRDLKFFGQTIP